MSRPLKGFGSKIPAGLHDVVLRLHRDGNSTRTIARMLRTADLAHVSHSAVAYLLRKLKPEIEREQTLQREVQTLGRLEQAAREAVAALPVAPVESPAAQAIRLQAAQVQATAACGRLLGRLLAELQRRSGG